MSIATKKKRDQDSSAFRTWKDWSASRYNQQADPCFDVINTAVMDPVITEIVLVRDVRHDLVLVEAVREIDDAGESAFLNVDP